MCAFERYCDRHNPDPSPAADKRAATVSSAVPSCQNHKAIHKTSMIPKSGNCFSEKSCANNVLDTARSPGSRPWSGERLDKGRRGNSGPLHDAEPTHAGFAASSAGRPVRPLDRQPCKSVLAPDDPRLDRIGHAVGLERDCRRKGFRLLTEQAAAGRARIEHKACELHATLRIGHAGGDADPLAFSRSTLGCLCGPSQLSSPYSLIGLAVQNPAA